MLKDKSILLSPSHKVIITTPESFVYSPSQLSAMDNNNSHHHHHHNNNNNNNQRQPLQQVNNTSNHHSTSSIRIIQQQHHQQQALNSYSHSVNMMNNKTTSSDNSYPMEKTRGQRINQATNLFIQSSATAGKVPLHLSEQGHNTNHNNHHRSSWLISPCKVPLFGALSGSLLSERLGVGSNNANSNNNNTYSGKQSAPNLESHLI